jgi:hypothetical protein
MFVNTLPVGDNVAVASDGILRTVRLLYMVAGPAITARQPLVKASTLGRVFALLVDGPSTVPPL